VVVLTASAAATWNLEPLQLAPRSSRRSSARRAGLARRRRRFPAGAVLFWLGIGLVVIALNSPVDEIGERTSSTWASM
jgi:hypothetical protein